MQVEELGFRERTSRIKERIISQPHEICLDRAKLFTESYQNTKDEPQIIRFAKAFRHVLNNMTIKIWDDEFIIGNRCSKLVGTPLFPEVRVDTLEQDIDTFENRPAQKMYIKSEDRDLMKKIIIPYWKNNEETVKEKFMGSLDPSVREVMDTLVFTVEAEMTNGVGHFIPGHDNLIRFGLGSIIKKAEEKLTRIDENPEKEIFLKSVIIECKAVQEFILRYYDLAQNLALEEGNERRERELSEIAKVCLNISSKPPNSFKEALQLIFFNHLACSIEDGGYAISIGRLDQILYPFFLNDIEEERITIEEVQFLTECFFLKLSTLWNYVFYLGISAVEGPPIAQNVTIGGCNRKGEDAVNELSYVILDAYSNLKSVQPTFSVRVNKNTPVQFLKKVGESIKSGTSIALFNDDVMIKGLINRGFSLEDAREYAPIGCVEPQHPHKSFGSTNANQLNIVKCLELALTNGFDMFIRREIGVKDSKPIRTYDDLWNAFVEQMKFFISNMVLAMKSLDETIAQIKPQPYLSACIDDCIERGLDITNGGAIYNFTGPQLIGLATVADSLAVIKKVVFEEKLLTLEQLTQILMKNYRGTYNNRKGNEWREIFINKVPKFGNDNDYVDQIAVDVAKIYCHEIYKYQNFRGGKFNPGIYSTSLHLTFGAFSGASADGRKSREPLSNGVGPTHSRDKKGPTAILNSVKKLYNELMTNGNSLLLAFHPNSMSEEIFIPLVQSFFTKEGGYQLQFNVVGKKTLCDAQRNPENYSGLVVRIAGYSVLFNELTKNAQDEIIARTVY